MNIKLFFITILVSTNTFSQEKKVQVYPFKSAIIEYKYEASIAGTHIKYIDDYGYKQADYIKKELSLGGNTEKEYEIIILIGDKAYTINLQDSTVAIGRNSTYTYYLQNQDKNSTDISEAIIRTAHGYHLKSTTDFLKKECKVWKSGKSTMVTWNGLELKAEINFMTMMVKKAVKIKIDKKIPEGVFDIPQGFKYISSDVYQGFSGLELDFKGKDSIPENNDYQIEVSFSTSSLGGSNNFEYYKSSGEPVPIEGVNDYNKIDNHLIKSQQNVLSSNEFELERSGILIFETQKGALGKMQLMQISDIGYDLRYVVFNSNGTINAFSNGSSKLLINDFDFVPNDNNNKLIISPKGKARCFVLGY